MPSIRDPIHGFISLSDEELAIVDSAPFQRLRNIKQLATSYLVYPGAEHTRFSHSLGVMYLADKAFNAAMDNYEDRTGKPLFGDNISRAWYGQVLRLIALTHDLGHRPFSHAFEKREGGIEHEEFTRKILFDTEIREHIQAVSSAFLRENEISDEDRDKYSITPELLWKIYQEKDALLDADYEVRRYNLIKDFMDSSLDCDKMDYLLRDAYYCGVNYGTYDVKKLISSLTVFSDERENTYRLAIQNSGLYAFEEFVVARYHMFMQVYFHKTRRYLDKLLIDAIEELNIPVMGSDVDIQEYLKFDDCEIMSRLHKAKEDPKNKSVAKFLARQVESCVHETHGHSNSRNGDTLYRIILKDLQKRFGKDSVREDLAPKAIIDYLSEGRYDELSWKDVPVFFPQEARPRKVMDESVLLKGLMPPINTMRIFVDKENKDEALKIVGELKS